MCCVIISLSTKVQIWSYIGVVSEFTELVTGCHYIVQLLEFFNSSHFFFVESNFWNLLSPYISQLYSPFKDLPFHSTIPRSTLSTVRFRHVPFITLSTIKLPLYVSRYNINNSIEKETT